MRTLLLCAAFFFPTLAVGQATLSRQGYTGGTPSIGGCTGPNATDTSTLPIGKCIQKDANSSIWINDCWANGVASLTTYTGSTTCDPAFASSLGIAGSTVPGSTAPSYCNVGYTDNPVSYNTFQCSAVSPTPTLGVQVNVYPKLGGATNCSGTPIFNPPQVVPAGVCTQLQGSGVGDNNPPVYVIVNCVNNLVTPVVYATKNCSVLFNSTGFIVPNSIGTLGPYAQVNATSAAGIQMGLPGSACAVNDQAYLSYTCVTLSAPTTPAPTTPVPTTTSPPTNKTSEATTVTTGTNTATAALAIMIVAAAAQLL